MAIFQIVNGKCHWRTPYQSLDELKGLYPPDCIFVDAPDYVNEQWGFDETEIGDDRFIRPEPPEGWTYDDETGQLMPKDMIGVMLEQSQQNKQNENNSKFAEWLSAHPLTWIDGKQYGVTLADQQEIALNLMSYQMAQAVTAPVMSVDENGDELATDAGQIANMVLEWHAIHEPCTQWTFEALAALSLAIRQYIYPGYQLNQQYKAQIYAMTSRKELDELNLDYSSLSPEEEIDPDDPAAPIPPADMVIPERVEEERT